MARSAETTVAGYLASLPPDRRAAMSAVRKVIRKRLPAGFAEAMQYGMISYHVPHARFPDTYNGQPLCLASLASQKGYMAVYLMGVYGDPEVERWFKEAYARSGKKLDMGKSCVRFKTLADLPVDVIGDVIAKVSVDALIAKHDLAHAKRRAR
jgi:uncharacterized protein YdhG (YjbR/CyaY superfamily)